MKTSWLKFAGALSMTFAVASIPGCGAGNMNDAGTDDGVASDDASMDLGQTDEALVSCTNVDGTNSVMAALAVCATGGFAPIGAVRLINGLDPVISRLPAHSL